MKRIIEKKEGRNTSLQRRVVVVVVVVVVDGEE